MASEDTGLINRVIKFHLAQRMWSPSINVTDGQTDGRTDAIRWQYRSIAIAWSGIKGREGKEREGSERYKKSQKRYISPIRGEAPCEQILTKFCTFGYMPDVIIWANFGVEKLRGSVW